MKKILRYLLLFVGIIAIAVGGFAAFIAIRGIPKYKAEKIDLHIESTPARVQQGQKLASMLCANCHLDENTGKFTGRKLAEAPQFGDIYSKNITQHPEFGIGKWTDGELVYLLRTGLKPDGTYLPPYMAKLVNISDEDLYSIISFLRSDNPWVQPDNTRQPDTKPSFLTKFLCNIGAMNPFPYPKKPITAPDTADQVKWGKYIATAQLECYSCHSRDFAKNDYFTPEKSKGFFGGGNELTGLDGKKIYTLNITMDEETGIGKWDEETFIKAVKYGQLPDGQPALRNPMVPFARLSDNEVRAIFAYLKTVPKIKNKVDRGL
jgi:mono/diheme cytochrome c family protein/cytochrome c2